MKCHNVNLPGTCRKGVPFSPNTFVSVLNALFGIKYYHISKHQSEPSSPFSAEQCFLMHNMHTSFYKFKREKKIPEGFANSCTTPLHKSIKKTAFCEKKKKKKLSKNSR